jgi:hypothetical protein
MDPFEKVAIGDTGVEERLSPRSSMKWLRKAENA